MNTVNVYDYLVVGGYFLFMVGIGFYFMRVNKGAREYFAGGNMIPWWVSGMTLYMANFSAWTFTGAAGFAYTMQVRGSNTMAFELRQELRLRQQLVMTPQLQL